MNDHIDTVTKKDYLNFRDFLHKLYVELMQDETVFEIRTAPRLKLNKAHSSILVVKNLIQGPTGVVVFALTLDAQGVFQIQKKDDDKIHLTCSSANFENVSFISSVKKLISDQIQIESSKIEKIFDDLRKDEEKALSTLEFFETKNKPYMLSGFNFQMRIKTLDLSQAELFVVAQGHCNEVHLLPLEICEAYKLKPGDIVEKTNHNSYWITPSEKIQ